MLTKVIRRTMLAGMSIVATAAVFAAATSVRSVRVTSQGATTAVIIEADGPLPRPRVGVLGNPPRIYLDFAGVKPATSGTYPDVNAPVHGVRVALNSAQPLITRVVLDLAMPMPHRIDATLRERGQLTVVVGPATQAPPTPATAPNEDAVSPARPSPDVPPPQSLAVPTPPVAPPSGSAAPTSRPTTPQVTDTPSPAAGTPPPAAKPAAGTPPPAAKPAAGTPSPVAKTAAPGSSRSDLFSAFGAKARAATGPLPAKDVEKYLKKAGPAIERLEHARPVLVSLDALSSVSDDDLKKAIDEFELIRLVLAPIDPPRKLEATHELLCKVCTLGATAVRARANRSVAESDRASAAASAAAGALMLLERARADLGLMPRNGS